MTIQNNKQGQNCFNRIKGAQKRLSNKIGNQKPRNPIDRLNTNYHENIGSKGNNDLQRFFSPYQIDNKKRSLFSQFCLNKNGFNVFAPSLDIFGNLAWSLQLALPSESHQFIKFVLMVFTEIARWFEITFKLQ